MKVVLNINYKQQSKTIQTIQVRLFNAVVFKFFDSQPTFLTIHFSGPVSGLLAKKIFQIA